MPKFKVELHRRVRDSYRAMPEVNPFLAPLPDTERTHRMLVRSWEFEAKDRAEVMRLLKEARQNGVGDVQGFTLRSIEQLDQSDEGSQP